MPPCSSRNEDFRLHFESLDMIACHCVTAAAPTCPGTPPVIATQRTSPAVTGFWPRLSGVGLARFAYTALMPQMVHAGWFTRRAGRLPGRGQPAGLPDRCSGRCAAGRTPGCRARAAWLLGSGDAQFYGLQLGPAHGRCSLCWRLISGIAGATLMVLGPSVAMAATLLAQRRAALGAADVLRHWRGCAAVGHPGAHAWRAAAWAPCGGAWRLVCAWPAHRAVALHARQSSPVPAGGHHPQCRAAAALAASLEPGRGAGVHRLCLAMRFGFVPHTVFWVDYLDRELHLGAGYASTQWAILACGAVCRPAVRRATAPRAGAGGAPPPGPTPSRPWPLGLPLLSGQTLPGMRYRAFWWGRCRQAWPPSPRAI